MRRFVLPVLVAIAVFTLAAPRPAHPGSGLFTRAFADQKDRRLPGLFDQLKAAHDADAADAIEQKIWQIWFDSGNAEIDALMAQGSDAMQANDYSTALDRFSRIIKKRPQFAEGWNRRATLYYMMGEYQKSLADIGHTLKLEPRHIGALSGLGLVDSQLNKLEAAEDAFKRVLAISPQNTAAQRNLDAVRELIKKKSI